MRTTADRFATTATVIGYMTAAVAIGGVIASGNVTLQALTGGAVLSAILLGAPSVALWLVLVGTLLLTGPLVFYFQGLIKLPWLFSVLGFFLLFAALLHEGLRNSSRIGRLPNFVSIGLAFVIYALASGVWADGTAADTVAGVKRMLQFWGVMFALAMSPFTEGKVRRMMLFVVILSVVQFPLAIYQRLFLVPVLQAQTLDAVTGTLELNQFGTGSSGVLGFWQILIVAALAAVYRERMLSLTAMLFLCAAVCVPIVIGDVNIVFIWLPMALAAIFYDQIRKRPLQFMLAAAIFFAALVAFGMFYLMFQQLGPVPTWSLEDRIRDLYEYNLGSRGYGSATDLTRTTVYSYWWSQHGMIDPVATMFGHGLGSVAGAGVSELGLRNGWRALDLVAASGLLWEVGIVGTALFVWMLISAGLAAHRLCEITDHGFDRVLARSALAAVVLTVGILPYSNTVLQVPSQQVLVFFFLGVLAWLDRKYASRRVADAIRVHSGPHGVQSA